MPRHTHRRLKEAFIEKIFLSTALFAIFVTAGILWVLAFETLAFFKEIPFLSFLTDGQWTPLFSEPHFGILPLLAGTILTSAIAMAVAAPTGLISAIYLSEYATERIRHFMKPLLEMLAAVPTIVYGYFALTWLTPLLQSVLPDLAGFNALSPGIVMGMMIMPAVASISEDALHTVPIGLREGGFALGATRFQVAFQIVLPSAISGVLASLILGVSRAVGETMIVAIAAGLQPRLTFNPLVPIETAAAYIAQISMGDVPSGTLAYRTLFAVGMALFVFTFALNGLSFILRKRFREIYE